PLILGGVSGDLTDLSYLSARRVRIALQGHQPFAAAVKAIHDTLRALRDGTPPGKLAGIADAELMKARDARSGLHEVDEGFSRRLIVYEVSFVCVATG